MQPLLDAATHIANEIANTRAHLSALEHALDGMRPLLAPPDQKAVEHVLGYSAAPRLLNGSALTVEEVPVRERVAEVTAAASSDSATASPAASNGQAKVTRAYTKRKSNTKTTRAAGAGAVRKNVARVSSGLPSTGGDFWLACMGKRKHTLSELLDTAISKLAVGPESRTTIQNRLNAWLYPAVKSGKLTIPGQKDGHKQYQVASRA